MKRKIFMSGFFALAISTCLGLLSSAWYVDAQSVESGSIQTAAIAADMLFAGSTDIIIPSTGTVSIPVSETNTLINTGSRGIVYKLIYEGALTATTISSLSPLEGIYLDADDDLFLHTSDDDDESQIKPGSIEPIIGAVDENDNSIMTIDLPEDFIEAQLDFEIKLPDLSYGTVNEPISLTFGDILVVDIKQSTLGAANIKLIDSTPSSPAQINITNYSRIYDSNLLIHLTLSDEKAIISITLNSITPALDNTTILEFTLRPGFKMDTLAYSGFKPQDYSCALNPASNVYTQYAHTYKKIYYGYLPNGGDSVDLGTLKAILNFEKMNPKYFQGKPFSTKVTYEACQGTRNAVLDYFSSDMNPPDETILEGWGLTE